MIKYKSVKALLVAVTTLSLAVAMYGEAILALSGKEYVSENNTVLMDSKLDIKPVVAVLYDKKVLDVKEETTVVTPVVVTEGVSQEQLEKEAMEAKLKEVVFEGMTLQELSDKLDRSLNSTLSGQGYTFASMAMDLGIDPYLAVAIVLHETGCKWNCSSLLKTCNNVGGMKGSTSCNGGAYASFPSLEEGIRAYMNNLYKNYVSVGLTTAEAMGPKYAASGTWASQVNAYINEIKAA